MALYLIAFNDEWVPDLTLEELRDRGTSGRALIEEMTAAGVFVFSDGGLDASTAVCSVDPRSGSPVFTDGPFAETKEHLGGFAVVDVPGDAEARYWAGRIAVAVGWPQEVHRFPHRALSADTQPGALVSLRCSDGHGLADGDGELDAGGAGGAVAVGDTVADNAADAALRHGADGP